MIITIDGPVASGKTSIARMLAKKLGFYYLSSGLLYRALAYILVHEFGYDEQKLKSPRVADIKNALSDAYFEYVYDRSAGEQVFYKGANITPFLKDQQISFLTSIMATGQMVYQALHALQVQIADTHDVVVEGRNAGSLVFPDADIKFYLTASLAVRVARFMADQKAKGIVLDYKEARMQVQSRDERDINRAIAPLVIPQNAIIIDDSELDKNEVLAVIEKEIREINEDRSPR